MRKHRGPNWAPKPPRHVGGQNEHADTWKILQGLKRLDDLAAKANNPGIYVQVATGAIDVPRFDGAFDFTKSIAPHPNLEHDEVKRELAKNRGALRCLAKHGIVPESVLDRIPVVDPKRRLNPPHVLVSNRLGQSGAGFKTLIRRLVDICREIGEVDAEKLSKELKVGIRRGELVHPFSLKPVHGQPAP